MWWNDLKEMRIWLKNLDERLSRIEDRFDDIEETFSSDDEYSSINRMHEKLDCLVKDNDRQYSVVLAMKTLDKFEDYMKNVDKLNSMINEFKGCVSMARGALAERKEASSLP